MWIHVQGLNDHNWASGHSWITRGQIRTVRAEAETQDLKLGLLMFHCLVPVLTLDLWKILSL